VQAGQEALEKKFQNHPPLEAKRAKTPMPAFQIIAEQYQLSSP